MALLLYDYVLTLGSEIYFFWHKAPLVARLIFASLRLSILGAVITTILNSYVPQYDEFVSPPSRWLRVGYRSIDARCVIVEAVSELRVRFLSGSLRMPSAASQHTSGT